MKRVIAIMTSALLPLLLFGQTWVDLSYSIQTDSNIIYGTATDFAGVPRALKMDVSQPLEDTPPECGRPLLVMIHGGSWIAGDKMEGYSWRIREDFAKRGYTTASVNYRLGQFHTNQAVNCNVPEWNCFNMTDSSEWYRANYRGIQDVKGAIRYLINHSETYNIDPNNVFVVGESAGGFIAMGLGFMDDASEVLTNLIAEYPDAPAPNALYENNCIQAYQLADNIASMDLSRPDLGSYEGTLNYPAEKPYKIRGVGNFYGGAFNNIFQAHQADPPALYLYHQPCDLIVPYNYGTALSGFVACAMGFPLNCGHIVNRPRVYGSQGIKNLIDALEANSMPTSEYFYDNTNNNYNCLQQATNPALSCHAIDNYALRTNHLAGFFAEKIRVCTTTGINDLNSNGTSFYFYPNPAKFKATIEFKDNQSLIEVSVVNLLGKVCMTSRFENARSFELNLSALASGIYLVNMKIKDEILAAKLIVK